MPHAKLVEENCIHTAGQIVNGLAERLSTFRFFFAPRLTGEVLISLPNTLSKIWF